MKSVKLILWVSLFLSVFYSTPASGQSQEAQQLLLDVQKLTQLKQILQNMYKGFEVLHNGYTAIKDISQGNFNIHKVFLDGLLAVSPTVQKYKRIADIMDYQLRIMKEYRSAYNQFMGDKNFSSDEIDYIGKVYGKLATLSLKNLDDLMIVITAGKLRMSDDERITMIDHIFSEVQDEWLFLNHFNDSAKLLSIGRAKEQEEIDRSRELLDIK